MSALPIVVRWLARVASVAAVLFVLAFAVGEGFAGASLSGTETAYLAIFLAGLLANLAAWRWEITGALIALVALFGLAVLQLAAHGGLPGPWFFALLGVPALCYLLARALRVSPPTAANA